MEEQQLPVDGMTISVRSRHDFVVEDAERFMAAARAAFVEDNPGATEDKVAELVADVYDAAFELLRKHGGRLPAGVGLAEAGWNQAVTHGEPTMKSKGCFDVGDPFAMPARTGEAFEA